jgi:tRNA-splicing ligase RtcB (3'-phosphate/5'-hydroxy nucleic acid ligase)
MTDRTYNIITTDQGVPIKAWTNGVEDAARP